MLTPDTTRETTNYRAQVDLLDPHNGIGALRILDLAETPEAVMDQGVRAAEEIRAYRAFANAVVSALGNGDWRDVAEARAALDTHIGRATQAMIDARARARAAGLEHAG